MLGMSYGLDGRLYGTTLSGGPTDTGTFFRFDLAGHLTQLAAVGVDDGTPSRLTAASDGHLYGTTTGGGAFDKGTVFRLSLPSGEVTTLHEFGTPPDGAYPWGGVVQGPDGRLYGTTRDGGTGDTGTVFGMETTGAPTVLRNLSGTDGLHPEGALVLGTDGALYGTTSQGGNSNHGTFFRITTAGSLTSLHSFAVAPPYGVQCEYSLIQANDGWFYGTTGTIFPSTFPTVYRVDVSGNFETLVPSFANGPLTQGADGEIYLANGPVFRIEPPPNEPTAVYTPEGAVSVLRSPYGRLVESPAGTLFGTAIRGVSSALFQADLSGELSFFHAFEGYASDGLLHLPDGSFYGTLESTWVNPYGSVFKVDEAGIETSLHEFSGDDGGLPGSGVIAGPSGELWGMTPSRDSVFLGELFKIDSLGTFTPLHDFDEGVPASPLVYAADGNVYGITDTSFFRSDSNGDVTPLHDFSEEGAMANWVIQASDGDFYGTMTSEATQLDSIFRMDSTGSLTPLHDFTTGAGRNLIQASDGSFYGTSPGGLGSDYGSVFRMDSDETVTTLHSFDGSNGGLAYPNGALLEASDGHFYGTTQGGPDNLGGIYRLLLEAAAPTLESIVPAFGRAAGGAAAILRGSHFRAPAVMIGGAPVPASLLLDQSTLTTLAPALTPGTLNDVTLTNGDPLSAGDPSSVTLPAAWFADFLDVPGDDIFHDAIAKIFRNGITAGCGGGLYCRNVPVTRAQMAVFLLKAEHGSSHVPPPCTGRFADVPCPSLFADWIEELAEEGITAGCGNGTNYCPDDAVTRQQMAVFLLKTEHGSGYVPPACAELFADVPCPSLFADWIEQLAAENITAGCGGGNYCPLQPNTRGQMAVFLTKTFSLP